jgi:hypothetical protein
MPKKPSPKFEPYKTHTGLLVYVAEPQEGESTYQVCIAGDMVKELLDTPDLNAAVKYANSIKSHYIEREEAERKAAET